MKIAFIVDQFPVLSEKFILDQITGLIDLGHNVSIFAASNPEQGIEHKEFDQYNLASATHYIPAMLGSRFARLGKTLLIISKILFRHPAYIMNLLFNIKKFKNPVSSKMLYYLETFSDNQFDVIKCHFGPAGIIGVFLKLCGVEGKVVTAFHGYDVTTFVEHWGTDVYKTLFKYGDSFTYNSEATKQKLLSLGCPAVKMTKIPMGINIDSITFKHRSIDGSGTIRILSVGRLVEMKGREYAIKAVASIIHDHPYVVYDIIGDGELRKSLEELIIELNVNGNIKLWGWVTTEELGSFYESAHIFLHPSIVSSDGNTEGQGVVLLEAQAAGIPVIATMHGAFPETVPDGESGFLVPEKDINALVEKISYVLNNPELMKTMGRKGRDHASGYDIKVLNKKLEGLFLSLIGN